MYSQEELQSNSAQVRSAFIRIFPSIAPAYKRHCNKAGLQFRRQKNEGRGEGEISLLNGTNVS